MPAAALRVPPPEAAASEAATIDDLDDPTTAAFNAVYSVDIPAVLGANGAYVGFTGAAGGAGDGDGQAGVEVLRFQYYLPQAIYEWGRIDGAYLSGPDWARDADGDAAGPGRAAFRARLGVVGEYGYLGEGPAQTRPLPWLGGFDQIAIRLSFLAGPLYADDLVLRGAGGATYAFSAFRFDPSTNTGYWRLERPVVREKLLVTVYPSEGLDGEWTNPSPEHPGGDMFPSGDGAPGGTFNYRINVLSGDVTGDGVVNALDMADVKKRLGRRPNDGVFGASAYGPFEDLNADGRVNALDVAAVKRFLGTRLSTLPEPAPVVAAPVMAAPVVEAPVVEAPATMAIRARRCSLCSEFLLPAGLRYEE